MLTDVMRHLADAYGRVRALTAGDNRAIREMIESW